MTKRILTIASVAVVGLVVALTADPASAAEAGRAVAGGRALFGGRA